MHCTPKKCKKGSILHESMQIFLPKDSDLSKSTGLKVSSSKA
ncbi:MAG: hypothetical protein Kow0083_13050 [Methylophaga sp.]